MGIIKSFFKGFKAGAPIKQPRKKLTKKAAFERGLALRNTMAENWAEKKATMKANIIGNVKAMGGKSNSFGQNVISNIKASAVSMAKSSQSASLFPTMKAQKYRPKRLF